MTPTSENCRVRELGRGVKGWNSTEGGCEDGERDGFAEGGNEVENVGSPIPIAFSALYIISRTRKGNDFPEELFYNEIKFDDENHTGQVPHPIGGSFGFSGAVLEHMHKEPGMARDHRANAAPHQRKGRCCSL